MRIQKSFESDSDNFYIIPTPIGNLKDITMRSLDILSELDVLFCEDTRVTSKLLNHYDLKCQLSVYNDHSKEHVRLNILKLIKSGQKIGLVSDAGMPVISDPGFKLIKFLKSNEIDIIVLPGASAFVSAMVYCDFGIEYLFYGFLKKNKEKELDILLNLNKNIILYESPYKLLEVLEIIKNSDHTRNILICRELTKMYEEYVEGNICDIVEHFRNIKIRGEFVIVISHSENETTNIDFNNEINYLIDLGVKAKIAAGEIAKKYGISKNELYNNYIRSNK